MIAGRLIPATQAAISIADSGFVLGVTATEQLRTFGGRLFGLDEHLRRLKRSLEILGIAPEMSLADIRQSAEKLASQNHALLAPGDDLGLGIFVTPGAHGTLAEIAPSGPVVGIYTYPLPFKHWADAYATGLPLRTTSIVQVPEKSWPRELKVRSRVHYYLADREAAAMEPGARALMLDEEGYITEGTTSNIIVFNKMEGWVTPPERKVLPGITLSTIKQLAKTDNVPFIERDLRPSDVERADEVVVCSTSSCVLPVVRFNEKPIGSGVPGQQFNALLNAWSRLVGIDVVAQARTFCHRSPR